MDAIFTDFNVSLVPPAQQANSSNCWTTVMVKEARDAFNRVGKRIPRGFQAAFNKLTFEIVDSGVDYGFTTGNDLVQWRRSGRIGIDTEITTAPDEFEKTVVHELGHVLVNRTSGSNRSDQQGMWQTAFGTSKTIFIGDQRDISSMPQKGRDGGEGEDIERLADAFMFWIYGALDRGVKSRVVSIYMEGGIIVWNRYSDTYPFLISASDPYEYDLENILAAIELASETNDPESVIEITTSPGIQNWIR